MKVNLAGGFEHTGIYVGNDKIIEVTNRGNGVGEIRRISSNHFLRGDGDSFVRMALSIYIACDTNANVLSNTRIADRAEARSGNRWDYSPVSNNCHTFTACCIDGDFNNPKCMNMIMLNRIIAMEFLDSVIASIDWRVGDF